MSSIRVSVPGRTEVAGNHEDHQGGCVIAAAVDRQITCRATQQEGNLITVESSGFSPFSLDLNALDFAEPHLSERYTTRSLVRGMATQLSSAGYKLTGCHLEFASDIPIGMGLSSSAAFELCCGTALLEVSRQTHPNLSQIEPLDMAKMALHCEQDFFNKPSGLMDQAICALGGVNFFDFKDQSNLIIEPIRLPASWDDYACLLIDCGHGHEDATNDYAQVALDMSEVARFLKVKQLRDINLDEYLKKFSSLRQALGDRKALRGYHFYHELDLVKRRLNALKQNKLDEFVLLSTLSGVSSAEYLHNVSMPTASQPAMVALMFCRMALEDAHDMVQKVEGACVRQGSARIHGGGFGGTIQVFLPREQSEFFMNRMDTLLGRSHCEEVALGAPGIQVEMEA